MSKTDRNMKMVGGNFMFRRFAYLHKKDHSRFGLLEATDSRNAREYLGRQFHIRQTWLTTEEESIIDFNRERKWEIVSSIFASVLETT